MVNKGIKMKKGIFLFLLALVFSVNCWAQNFFNENIKTIISQNRGVYFTDGIFIKNGPKMSDIVLKDVRQFYSKKLGHERVVFDFNQSEIPRIYSYFSKEKRKVYIDMFGVKLNKKIKSTGNGILVRNLIFYPLDDAYLSVEIDLNKNLECELFYLTNPGRLVLDIKS